MKNHDVIKPGGIVKGGRNHHLSRLVDKTVMAANFDGGVAVFSKLVGAPGDTVTE
jgi:hypothetical protein